VEHGHDEDLSSGYCRCAQVNAIIAGTALVDEQTSGLNERRGFHRRQKRACTDASISPKC
jgi:hypothetical protein